MRNFFIGLLIGAGAILPGVSSGVFLVTFGLYEKLVDTILHFFKNIKDNFLFLCPIILGSLFSIFIFSKILLYTFNHFFIYTSFAFIGLILGSVSSIKKQANVLKPNFIHIMCFILSFVVSIYLIIIEKGSPIYTSSFSYYYLIFAGFAMSAGIIIPGVSKTAILIILGVYSNYLTAISTLNFSFIIPLGIGLAFGSIVFIYVINFLFSHFKSYTYFLILGFVIASCFVIYPGFSFNIEYMVSVLIGCVCFYFVKNLDKIHSAKL